MTVSPSVLCYSVKMDAADVYEILVNLKCLCYSNNEMLFNHFINNLKAVENHKDALVSENRTELLLKCSVIRILELILGDDKPCCFTLLSLVLKSKQKLAQFLNSLVVIDEKQLKYNSINAILSLFRVTQDLDLVKNFCDAQIDANEKFDFLNKIHMVKGLEKRKNELNELCSNSITRWKITINYEHLIDIKLNKLNVWVNSRDASSYIESESFLKLWANVINSVRELNMDNELDKLPKIQHVQFLFNSTKFIEVANLLRQILQTKGTIQKETADLILEKIKEGWLNCLNIEKGYQNYFIGVKNENEESNSVLMREIALLVLSALNCISHNIMDSELEKVLHTNLNLSKWVKSGKEYQEMDHWLTSLFIEQDDQLVTAMLYSTQIYINLKKSESSLDLSNLNPHNMFLSFLSAIGMEPETLIDFLTSHETNDILVFFVKYLKIVLSEWDAFVNAHQENILELDSTMSTLIRLRLKLERLTSKNLFPYNIKPLCKLIKECENLYEK